MLSPNFATKTFAPYNLVGQAPDRLEMQLGKGMGRFMFFIQRIFPFVISLMLVFAISLSGSEVPIGIKILIIAMGFVGPAILLYKRVIYKITIDSYGIQLESDKMYQRITEQFTWGEIEKMQYRIRRGKGSGVFYKMVFTSGKKLEFLRLSLWNLRPEAIEELNYFLSHVSLREVEKRVW